MVEKVGEKVTKVRPDDHVVLGWDYCGECAACKAERYLYCHNFFLYNYHGAHPDGIMSLKKGNQDIHGSFFNQLSFADFALANLRNVVKVTMEVPLQVPGPLGCGVRTGAGAVINWQKA